MDKKELYAYTVIYKRNFPRNAKPITLTIVADNIETLYNILFDKLGTSYINCKISAIEKK